VAGLGLVAILAALAGVVLGAGGGGVEPDADAGPPELQLPLKRLIGQRLVVRMERPTAALKRQARRGEIGGVVLFPPPEIEPEDLRRQVNRVQRAAVEGGNPPLLVAIDQEGFPVRRLPKGPPSIPPPALAGLGDAADPKLEGQATGNYLKGAGVNADLMPVLDVPSSSESFMIYRAYSIDAKIVAKLGAGIIRGLDSAGVAATAKHFPGLGHAPLNTDLGPSTVEATQAQLEAGLLPFKAAIRAGVPMVMVSNAVYVAYDSDAPAVLSERVVRGELRERLGFEGVVISDDLEASSILAITTPAEAAVRAAISGVDLLMFARTGEPAAEAAERLLRTAKRGRLSRSELEASYRRIVALRERVAVVPGGATD
jgi:beta-N-acetylhexosaminidase